MHFINSIVKKLFTIVSYILAFSLGVIFILTLVYPLGYRNEINNASNDFDIDPILIASIIRVESNYFNNAISRKEAKGLMQITDKTGNWGADELGLKNYNNETLFDANTNIKIGTWYIKKLETEFNGDMDLVLAAYNAGSGNVSKWLNDPEYSHDGSTLTNVPFPETKNYIKSVKNKYIIYDKLYNKKIKSSNKFLDVYFEYILKLRNYIKEIKF